MLFLGGSGERRPSILSTGCASSSSAVFCTALRSFHWTHTGPNGILQHTLALLEMLLKIFRMDWDHTRKDISLTT